MQILTNIATAALVYGFYLLVLLLVGLVAVGQWRTFVKTGHPGWAIIVPFYRAWVLARMAGLGAGWGVILSAMTMGALGCGVVVFLPWFFLSVIETVLENFPAALPVFKLVTLVLSKGGWPLQYGVVTMAVGLRFYFCLCLAAKFDGSWQEAVLLFLFTPICLCVWGFGKAQYFQHEPPARLSISFEPTLAWRYLRPKRTASSFITIISVVGVMLGVAVLIIVNSVFSGFHLQLKETFFQFTADLNVREIKIYEEDGLQKWRVGPIGNYNELADQLGRVKGVKGTMPVVVGKVMLETQPKSGPPMFDAPVLYGVDAERMEQVSQVPLKIVEGEFDLTGNGLVVGYNYGRKDGMFQLDVGDRVLIYSPQSLKQMKDAREEGESIGVLPEEYTVKGVFDAGQGELNNFMFCSLYNAQDLYHLDDVAHVVWVETDDPMRLEPVIAGITNKIGENYYIGTWKELNPVLLQQVEVEKNVTGFLMFFIVIVAAFGIASSLIIFGIQKTKEIGLLKSVGANNGQAGMVFLIQSTVVGLVGTVLGVGLGVLVKIFRNDLLGVFKKRGVELFPEELYGFSELPAQLVVWDVVVICIVSLLICMVAGFLPAWIVGKMQPVEALRNE